MLQEVVDRVPAKVVQREETLVLKKAMMTFTVKQACMLSFGTLDHFKMCIWWFPIKLMLKLFFHWEVSNSAQDGNCGTARSERIW